MTEEEKVEKKKTTTKKVVSEEPDAPMGFTKEDEILDILKSLSAGFGDLNKRVKRIETGGADDFKAGVKSEDVEAAKTGRAGVDSRITKIVDEMLGEDFGVEMAGYEDRPGFLFTVIVPKRLSDNKQGTRPMLDPANKGTYLKNALGDVLMEDYYPEDRRSRSISDVQNFDALREHCDRVRAYIVTSFQKQSKPLPEFKVK